MRAPWGWNWRERSGLLERVCTTENLLDAWRRVHAARGGAGGDAVTLAAYEADLAGNLERLARALRDGSYVPVPPRRFTLPKPDGGARDLAILAVADRVAQRAVYAVIEPLFEARFLPCSYAYRPRRNTAQAVAAVLAAHQSGATWVVNADIALFFDALDHQRLLREAAHIVSDERVLRLLHLWLAAGALATPTPPAPAPLAALGMARDAGRGALTWSLRQVSGVGDEGCAAGMGTPYGPGPGEALRRAASGLALLALTTPGTPAGRAIGRAMSQRTLVAAAAAAGGAAALATSLATRRHPAWITPGRGAAQGSVLSPLLSNVYLHPLDAALSARYPNVVRYADNILIPCRDEDMARQALIWLTRALADLDLTLQPNKTSVHPLSQPFTFLGYRLASGHATPPQPRARQALDQARVRGTSALRQGRQTLGRARQGAAQVAGTAGTTLRALPHHAATSRREISSGGKRATRQPGGAGPGAGMPRDQGLSG